MSCLDHSLDQVCYYKVQSPLTAAEAPRVKAKIKPSVVRVFFMRCSPKKL